MNQLRSDPFTGGGIWECYYCARWGFSGDAIGRVCEWCFEELCEECNAAHDCLGE